ncbi:MAG: glycoside hydrolase family 3 protein [Firmicutes bacterium]|nr:glycoside hydrolase family 3 protein [Bacillota bacterium]
MIFRKIILLFFVITLSSTANISSLDVKDMTLEEKIGQMICLELRYWSSDGTAPVPVTEVSPEAIKYLKENSIGSVILYGVNLVDIVQTVNLTTTLGSATDDPKCKPVLIMTDQEGGRVERATFKRKPLKNNLEIETLEEAFEKGAFIGKELKYLGINCNLAPVVDVNSNPDNPIIKERSFGSNPEVVSEFSKAFVKGLHKYNIIATAKHFPGHGDTSKDSHFELPIVNKSFEELNDLEFKPFKAVIDIGIDMIMTAHIALPKIESKTIISKEDGQKMYIPATLSKIILTDILRGYLGFNGVIISDSMGMNPISKNLSPFEAAKMAINAGVDILCMPFIVRNKNDIKKIPEFIEFIKNEVLEGRILESRINESVERILKMKSKISTS